MNLLINIDVDDLDRAIAFYTQAFGLRCGRRFGSQGVEMLGAAAPIYLLVKAAGSYATGAVDAKRSYRRHWTPLHLDIVVDDVDAAVTTALRAGAVLEDAVASHVWGSIAHLVDPFGHGFCLVQFHGSGYDEICD